MDSKKKMVRRDATTKLAGVCGAVADYFDVDPTLIRVIYTVLTVFSVGFPGLLLYLFLVIIIPKENNLLES